MTASSFACVFGDARGGRRVEPLTAPGADGDRLLAQLVAELADGNPWSALDALAGCRELLVLGDPDGTWSKDRYDIVQLAGFGTANRPAQLLAALVASTVDGLDVDPETLARFGRFDGCALTMSSYRHAARLLVMHSCMFGKLARAGYHPAGLAEAASPTLVLAMAATDHVRRHGQLPAGLLNALKAAGWGRHLGQRLLDDTMWRIGPEVWMPAFEDLFCNPEVEDWVARGHFAASFRDLVG